MDFADEHYVKLFTRKTPTRQLWPWQARALHPNLLMVLNKAGVLDVGRHDPVRSVAVMVDLPADIVEPGLQALLEDGTVELVDGRIVMPKFLEAQESRKTRSAVARDYREKARDTARAKSTKSQDGAVTESDQTRPKVTASDPPTPARPRPLPDPEIPSREKPRAEKATEKPSDPRHAPLREKLMEAFRRKRGADLPWAGRQGKTLQRLLDQRAREDLLWPTTLLAAFGRALLATHPDLKSLEDFERDIMRYVGTGPPGRSAERAGAATAKDTDWSNYKEGDTARELFGDT